MAKVQLANVAVLDNPSPFLNPFQFEVTFECIEELKEDLEWKMIYVGSAESEEFDQVLDTIYVGPIPEGRHMFVFQADPPDVSRIPVNDALGVTVVLLTCSYRGHEFVRVGYFINNEYNDAELRENPPPQPQFDKVQRNILGDKPRVTRFKINWDDGTSSTTNNVPDGMDAQSLEETSQDAPTSTLGFTESTHNSMEVMCINQNRMEDIMILKNKYVKVSDIQLRELLEKKLMLLDHVKTEQEKYCNEDETKIQELTSKITAMKQSLQSEKQTLEVKEHDLSKQLNIIAELETERNKFMEENHTLELKRNKLKTIKRNIQDQELLDRGRKKYNLYKELSRIRWHYGDAEENVKGYVSNKVDYIHHFCYKSEDSNLTNHLWQEIYLSTALNSAVKYYEVMHEDNKDSANKENIVQNK
ncbi:uncharacterized protein LOC144473570 [Augochlora pura]